VRQEACNRAAATNRLKHAVEFLELAELGSDEAATRFANASAALAVLAGIAASDAICCARLGTRSRSQDHRDAQALLEKVEPDGRQAAESLRRLLDMKDSAQYGVAHLGRERVKAALRQARILVQLAQAAMTS
jgi:triphosphoribosyl-dephospho-CoA synthetase